MDGLQKLKAEAYDLLAIIEEAQRQLQAKNNQIRVKTQETQQLQPEIVDKEVTE